MEQVKDAERLDPEFWEIHRVKGFILGQARNFDAAAQAYERALELAPSQRAAAVVKYWYAQHLTKVAESSRGRARGEGGARDPQPAENCI